MTLIDYVETLAQQDKAIGEWEIKQIHKLILRKIAPEEAGRYRQLDIAHSLAPIRGLVPIRG